MSYGMKSNSRKTVLVGMTGNISSLVACYLLKKQGHKVIGIGINFFDPNNPLPGFPGCISDLNVVKELCDTLEISFYGVNAIDDFQASVLDPLIASRLFGRSFTPSVYFNELLLNILYKKMVKLDGDLIATGHYAKVQFNQNLQKYFIMSASDLINDQSFGLARVPQTVLSKLVLPLAEIGTNEVEKVAKILGRDEEVISNQFVSHNFMTSRELIPVVEQNAPLDMLKEGSIYNYYEETTIQDHPNMMHYALGEENLARRMPKLLDNSLIVGDIHYRSGSVFLISKNRVSTNLIVLKKFLMDDELDISRPIRGYFQFKESGERYSCLIEFKNNKYVKILIDVEKIFIPRGATVVIYNRKDNGAKIIGSGVVHRAGLLENEKFTALPKRALEEDDDEDDKNTNTDPTF